MSEEEIEYEGEPVDTIFVSYDEDNKVFYMEINDDYGFILTPQQSLEFVNKYIKVIDEIIKDGFKTSMNSFLNAHRQAAMIKIESGDESRAVEEIERMLSENDNGTIAS
jgi:hypothetical protein